MTTAVQHRRGTTAEHSTFTGLEGEVTIDTTKDTAVIHDGALAGGYPLAKETLSNANPTTLGALDGASSAADDLFMVYDTSASQMKKMTRAELNNAIVVDALDTVDINGGTIDSTAIGSASASTGAFTTLTSSSTTTLNGTTIPSSVTLVSTAATQTLTNKTISADNNTISGIAASSFVLSDASGNLDGSAAQKAIPSGVVVGTTDTQTLTNKTINLSSNTLTATSAQIAAAVTDETGTGALVFGTNPTITGGTINPTTLQEGSVAAVVQSDIGTAPNEIPLNQYLGALAYEDTETPALDVGTGITAGTGTICKANGGFMGGVYRMTVLIDLTGLNSGGTAGDIIGVNGTANPCYIARLPAMTVLGGRMTCLETPAGGDTDIDLYSAAEGTGVEDAAITGLTETQIINAGAQTAGTVTYFSADPAANSYLYLVGQGTANATYTAGRFLVEIFGV